MSDVSFVKTRNRKEGVKASIRTLGINPVRGKHVLIKPNFNTADPVPGSTDNETLLALVDELWEMGSKSIALGERSYPPTHQVMQRKGILPGLAEKEVRIVNFDELDDKDWVEFIPKDSHWSNGFRVARPIIEADCLVSTCCLKTHQYGGVFTMSLKLHVGVVPTHRHGYEYMAELHGSPYQESFIAEINEPFAPDLIVLDGVDTFVDGGPMSGKRANGDVFLASTDRIAIDAVGVAILKTLGSNHTIMGKPVFEQGQIKRAVELGLGVSSAQEVKLVAADAESEEYRHRVVESLMRE